MLSNTWALKKAPEDNVNEDNVKEGESLGLKRTSYSKDDQETSVVETCTCPILKVNTMYVM